MQTQIMNPSTGLFGFRRRKLDCEALHSLHNEPATKTKRLSLDGRVVHACSDMDVSFISHPVHSGIHVKSLPVLSLVSSDTRGSVACSLPTPCRPALTSHPNQGTLAQYHVLTRSSPSVKCQGQGQTFATVPEVQGHGASEHVLQQQEISPSQRSECPRCLSGESVRVWTNINERLLQLDLPEWGWEKQQGMLLPVYTDKAVAPDELLNRVHCICKAACATAVCSCRKHGLVCSVSCSHCRGEICFNSMNWISVEVSDSEPEC